MACILSFTWPQGVLAQKGGRAALTLPGKRPITLRLRADRLSYRRCASTRSAPASRSARRPSSPCRARLVLVGHVTLRGGALSLESKELVATIDDKGKLLRLIAQGGVRVTIAQRRGSAHRVVLFPNKRRVALLGAARLICPDLHLNLRGKRIEIDLDGRHLVVDDARAEVALPVGGR
ncbi:MAG: hypothetical protein KAI47_08835 [Deltaproteobacteria bacterium]|nr:hypothetical protein [Deltaproteobacteria bacterium]